jgi:RNA polymerase sigma factor (sigma-70 family)
MKPAERSPLLDPAFDARLVERCLAGDARAWELLVRRYERLVYAVAHSYHLSEPDLGDVFQDVFTALVRGLPRLREARALCRWLSSTTDRIARATALRLRRERMRTAGDPTSLETLPADLPAAGANLEALEEQTLVRLALAALPERCRGLLHALYYEDPPPAYATLARRLGVPVGSLGPTRARCIDRLRAGIRSLGAEAGSIITGAPPTSEDRSGEGARPRRVRPAARNQRQGYAARAGVGGVEDRR